MQRQQTNQEQQSQFFSTGCTVLRSTDCQLVLMDQHGLLTRLTIRDSWRGSVIDRQPLRAIRAERGCRGRRDPLVISQGHSQLISQFSMIAGVNVVKHATTSKLDLKKRKRNYFRIFNEQIPTYQSQILFSYFIREV